MPFVQRGIVFRYFDKALFALAVVGFLAALAYVVKRGQTIGSGTAEVRGAENVAAEIQSRRQKPPPEPKEPVDFVEYARSGLRPDSVPESPVPEYEFNQPIKVGPGIGPDQYEYVRVGQFRKDVVLEFKSPLTPGSVEVVAGGGLEGLVKIVEHPHEDDYAKVLVETTDPIKTRAYSNVVGMAGQVPHEMRIVVDKTIDKTPYAPLNLEVTTVSAGATVRFEQDPRVEEEGVLVDYYEIMRKDRDYPLAEWEPVAKVTVTGEALGDERRLGPRGDYGGMLPYGEPDPEMFVPYGEPDPDLFIPEDAEPDPDMFMPGDEELPPDEWQPGGRRRSGRRPSRWPEWRPGTAVQPTDEDIGEEETLPEAEEPEKQAIVWLDRDVEPGGKYLYRVRMVGMNTYPTKGELFTETVAVEITPEVDVRVASVLDARGRMPGRATVDIVQRIGTGPAGGVMVLVGLQIRTGDAIAGVGEVPSSTMAGGVRKIRFDTGFTLVDCHANIMRQNEQGRNVMSSRIIYADSLGNLHELWKDEQRTDLWQRVSGRPGREPGWEEPDERGSSRRSRRSLRREEAVRY
jgi:hypothetical protein